MDLGLKHKTAFVAASSRGLGKSVALELAKEGAKIIICGRKKEDLERTRKEIEEKTNQELHAFVGDLSVSSERERIIKATLQVHKKVDILVTNTGGPPAGRFEQFSEQDWDNAYHQLLSSAVGLINGFLPAMKSQRWGRIISITSMAVKQPINTLVLSNSVRASVVGLVKTLANELGGYNITVNNLMPGYTKTARLESLI